MQNPEHKRRIQHACSRIHQIRNIDRNHPQLGIMNRSFPERIKRILIAQSWNKRLNLIHRLHRITIELNSVLHVKALERCSISGAQPIPSRLHRIKPHISMDEPPPQLRRNRRRNTTATKEIGYEHSFIGRRLDNALQQSFRLLRGITSSFLSTASNVCYIIPAVIDRNSWQFIQKNNSATFNRLSIST